MFRTAMIPCMSFSSFALDARSKGFSAPYGTNNYDLAVTRSNRRRALRI